MLKSKLSRLISLMVLLGASVWLLSIAASPGRDTAVRQQALSSLAPVGSAGNGAELGGEKLPTYLEVSPVSVNLRDIPAGVYDPNNQYDRWLRGEIDMESELLRSSVEIAALQAEAMKLAPSDAIQRATESLGPNAPVLGTNFDSLDINDCCGGGANVPPDPEMAAGPNHVIAVVNVALEIYDKSGTLLTGPVTLSSFFGAADAACSGSFDPNVLYDEKADRYMIAADGDGTHYCAAVSQTGDPQGAYWIYAFPVASGTEFFDYPHAGIGEDAIYVGANIFKASFFDSRVYALDKAAMYTGASAAIITQSLGINEDTPQPLNLHGFDQGTWPADDTHYFFTETGYNGADHTLWMWDGPFSGPNTFASVASVDLNAATGIAAGFPVNVQQSGGSTITANDWRPLDFEYRNGYGWTTMTVACNPGGGTVNCVRWAQIDLSTGAIGPEGAGVYSSGGDYRFFPDLAVNNCNDMAVGYTKSNTSIFPAVWVTGRENTDPAGTLQAETQLKAGEITYTAFDGQPRRWGDYTGMTIDPDGQTFWYLGEYSKITGNTSGRWGTYIGSFTYPGCSGSGGDTMHVGDLDGKARIRGDRWKGTVRVTIHDASENPVSNATVSLTVTTSSGGGPFIRTCITNGTGTCRAGSPVLSLSDTSVNFTVDSVTHGTFSYSGGDNHDPDGDSDGTNITLNQPIP